MNEPISATKPTVRVNQNAVERKLKFEEIRH